jgi:hypothetical protein
MLHIGLQNHLLVFPKFNIFYPPPLDLVSTCLSLALSCPWTPIDVPQCVLSNPFEKNPSKVCSSNAPWLITTLFIFHET